MGNRIKHEVKVLTYHEIGMALDSQLEAAEGEKKNCEGAKSALTSAKTHIEGLAAHVDKDLKEGLLDLDQVSLIKKWLVRSVNVIQNLALQAEVQAHVSQGKISALTAAVKQTKSLYDAEKVRLDAVVSQANEPEAIDERRPDARVSGEHPGNPIADRKAEAEDSKLTATPETLLVGGSKKRGKRKDAKNT